MMFGNTSFKIELRKKEILKLNTVPKNINLQQLPNINSFANALKNADKNSTFFGPTVRLDDEDKEEIDDFFIDCSRGSLDSYPVHFLILYPK